MIACRADIARTITTISTHIHDQPSVLFTALSVLYLRSPALCCVSWDMDRTVWVESILAQATPAAEDRDDNGDDAGANTNAVAAVAVQAYVTPATIAAHVLMVPALCVYRPRHVYL